MYIKLNQLYLWHRRTREPRQPFHVNSLKDVGNRNSLTLLHYKHVVIVLTHIFQKVLNRVQTFITWTSSQQSQIHRTAGSQCQGSNLKLWLRNVAGLCFLWGDMIESEWWERCFILIYISLKGCSDLLSDWGCFIEKNLNRYCMSMYDPIFVTYKM